MSQLRQVHVRRSRCSYHPHGFLLEGDGPRDRQPRSLTGGPLAIGIVPGVGVPEVQSGIRRPEQRSTEHPVPIPIPRIKPITRVAADELRIGVPLGVTVAEVHQPAQFAMQTDRLDTVTVEAPDKRLVARIPDHIRGASGTQPAIVRTELADDVERLIRRPIGRHRTEPVAVEIPGDRDVSWLREEELDVGVALGVFVAEIHVPVGLAIQPRRLDTVPVPIANRRVVTWIAVEERGDLESGAIVEMPPAARRFDQTDGVKARHDRRCHINNRGVECGSGFVPGSVLRYARDRSGSKEEERAGHGVAGSRRRWTDNVGAAPYLFSGLTTTSVGTVKFGG